MRKTVCGVTLAVMMAVCSAAASAQVSIAIGSPNVSIGINLPFFPELTPVPGYPVYYAPQIDGNYFFYDGMYWVYQDDSWYASSWYNGPWAFVQPEAVPLFVLRIPVRYYRQPPVYFHGWQANAPPRWGQHWGNDWEQQRRGWDHWNRKTVPARAPRPVYQRQYAGDRYPSPDRQHSLRNQSYRYQPRDKVVRQHLQQHAAPAAPHTQPPQRGDDAVRKPVMNQPAPQQHRPEFQERKQQQPGAVQREQQDPRLHDLEQRPNDRNDSKEHDRGRGQGQNKDDERGRDRNR